MFSFFERFFKYILVQILIVIFSILATLRLIYTYIINFTSIPWQPKDRILMEPPVCLADKKYGVHKYVTVNKVRIHYVESGDKSKPLMVFLHGFPEFWYSWRHQITEFSTDYWVVALDLRGFYQSDKPRDVSSYEMDEIVTDIKLVIERLNRKQCILVGHDWGAIIGFEFVSQYKHMVYKYIMLGAPSREVIYKLVFKNFNQLIRVGYFFVFQMPFLPEKLLSAVDYGNFYEMWNRKFTDNFSEEDLEAYKYVYSKPGAITAALNIYRANALFVDKPKNKLGDGSDGLYVIGQRDRYISHASVIVMANEYPKLKVEVIPNANHFVHQDKPEQINSLIRTFLGTVPDYVVENLV